jgi:hypothetical protein
MTIIDDFDAVNRGRRCAAAVSVGVLLAAAGPVGEAVAAVDCNPTPIHRAAPTLHRPHHGPAKSHVRSKGKKPGAAKKVAGHECQPQLAVTLADIGALGPPEEPAPIAAVADFAPDVGPANPEAEGLPVGFQSVSFPSRLSAEGASGPAGEPGGGGGLPTGGGFPGAGGPGGVPGGGTYVPPPGSGGFPGQGGLPGVPEPGTWTMMIVGLGAVGAVARRRRLGPLARA